MSLPAESERDPLARQDALLSRHPEDADASRLVREERDARTTSCGAGPAGSYD